MNNKPFPISRMALAGLVAISILVHASGFAADAQQRATDQRYFIYVDGIT